MPSPPPAPPAGVPDPEPHAPVGRDEAAIVVQLADDYRRMREEIGKVIIGQEAVVEQLLTALFARGHVLLVGVPGLAKTLAGFDAVADV